MASADRSGSCDGIVAKASMDLGTMVSLPRSNALAIRINWGTVSCGGSCRRALNQGKLGPPHAREVKLGLRDSAGALEHDCILAVAGDFADERVQLFRKCRG